MTSDCFIQDVLSKSGERMVARQGREISSLLNTHSGHLLEGRRASVSGNRLTMEHPDYERFLDMRKLGRKKHKRARIHNRFVYGCYASIAAWLMNGYTENISSTIKSK